MSRVNAPSYQTETVYPWSKVSRKEKAIAFVALAMLSCSRQKDLARNFELRRKAL
jgi:hypothetical protein